MRLTAQQSQMLADIARRFDLCLVILFGSRARGRVTPLSDIDIAVLPRRGVTLSAKRHLELITALADLFGTDRLDVVLLDQAGPLLRYEAMTQGITLLDFDTGLHADLHLRALRDYEDTKHFRAVHQRAMQKHLKAGTFGKIL